MRHIPASGNRPDLPGNARNRFPWNKNGKTNRKRSHEGPRGFGQSDDTARRNPSPPPPPFFFSCAKQFDIVVQTEPSGSVIRYPFAHTTVAAFILSTFPPLSGSIGPRSGKNQGPTTGSRLGAFYVKILPRPTCLSGQKKK